jgi:hypothetical protein
MGGSSASILRMKRMQSRLENQNTALPNEFHSSHTLCFTAHDIALQLLKSGMESGIFVKTIKFKDEAEANYFSQADDIFEWLRQTNRINDEADILVSMVFPAILGDMLHCIFEALEASRKGKLGVAFMLLRKPIQESLYVLESVVADKEGFARLLSQDSVKLQHNQAGGVEGHKKRIQKVLEAIGATEQFDSLFLAKIRYDKNEEGGFDRVCNKAMHLFTTKEPIKTENYNVNFIFSGRDAAISQWSLLYSRLPYIMLYMVELIDNISLQFADTLQLYRDDMNRRLTAQLITTFASIPIRYRYDELNRLVNSKTAWLNEHCESSGFEQPGIPDLKEMGSSGAFPGESESECQAREMVYEIFAKAGRGERDDR